MPSKKRTGYERQGDTRDIPEGFRFTPYGLGAMIANEVTRGKLSKSADVSKSDVVRSSRGGMSSDVSHLPKGVPMTPTGDVGRHRGMEAEELGTFKGGKIYTSGFKTHPVRQTYEPFRQKFTPREKP